jgi:hypothetical protein
LCRRWLSTVENHFGKKLKNPLRRKGNCWSEFSAENSRSPTSRQISWRSKGVTESAFKGSSSGEAEPQIQANKGRWICPSISISGFRGLKSRNLCIKTHEVRSPEKAESLVVGPAPGIMLRVDILGFREIENRDLGVRGAELHDIATHELAIRRNLKSARGRSSVDCCRVSGI